MRMDPKENTILEVTLKSRPEYLSRIRTIAACLADGAGMDRRESDNAALALTEACANVMRRGSLNGESDTLGVAFAVARDSFTANVAHSGLASADAPRGGVEIRLMPKLADDVDFPRYYSSLTARTTRRARRLRMLVNCGAELAI